MYRRLLSSVVVVCLCFGTILSLRCYTGTDRQCMLSPNMNDCGPNETCQCTKYRFQCTKDDRACDKHEQLAETKKWAYTIVSKSTCEMLKSASSVYNDAICCSKNGCNRPDTGRCSWSQSRRRARRKLTDLLDF